MRKNSSYDFIVLGGGSAGCVLANRLSQNKEQKVAVLEAGRRDHRWDFRIHMPSALAYPLQSRFYNWWYESDSEPFMEGRKIYQPRGKVLGGSSCINGMIWIRGHPGDYQKWAQNEGLEHWDYASCLPYFKKVEQIKGRNENIRGQEGPLRLRVANCDNPLFRAFFESVKLVNFY